MPRKPVNPVQTDNVEAPRPRRRRVARVVDPTGRIDLAANKAATMLLGALGAAVGVPNLGNAFQPVIDSFTRTYLPGKPLFTREQLTTGLALANRGRHV